MQTTFHQKNFNYLKTALGKGSLHHSYIFYGPSGAGKFDFATFFAKYIQCEKKGDNPCGECKNCKANKDGFIVDSYIMDFGQNESIKIDEVSKVRDFIGYSSIAGNRKIVIVNNAQNMTRDSKDVLLKTLEEPPEQSLIILITDEARKIPKTILSRCPSLFFSRPKWEEGVAIDETRKDLLEISQIMHFGKKDFLEDIQNTKREVLLEKYSVIVGELDTLLGQSHYSKMILAKDIAGDDNPKGKIEIFISILYRIMLYKQGDLDWDKGTEDMLNSLEKNLEYDKIVKVLEKMLAVLDSLDTNVSKRVMFEDFVLQI